MNPGQPFGKTEFWECLCMAREAAMTSSNVLSGFQATGIWPLWPEEVLEQKTMTTTTTTLISTPIKVSQLRKDLSQLTLTPYSRAIINEYGQYIEKKLVQYRTVDPSSNMLKVLRSGTMVKPRSMKQLQGPRTLDRAYVKCEKARIAKQEVEKLVKVAKAEERAMQRAAKAAERAQATTGAAKAQGGTRGRGQGGGRVRTSRVLRQKKFCAEEGEIDRIEREMSFLQLCGKYLCNIH